MPAGRRLRWAWGAWLLSGMLAACGSSPSGAGRVGPEVEVEVTVGCSSAVPGATATTAFCVSADSGAAPLAVRAVAAGSPTQVAWDFGDSAVVDSAQVTHVFTEPGIYTLTVHATAAGGARNRGSRQVTVGPPVCRITGPTLCRVGQTMALGLVGAPPYSCSWSARQGQIAGSAASALYVAPQTPGHDLLRAVFNVNGVPFEVTREIEVYRQFVILKADDLGVRTPRWERYLDYLQVSGVATMAGIIGVDLAKADASWVQRLLDLQAAGLCEYFHHGWSHATGENLDGTTPGTTTWEFYGTGYEFQKAHLAATLALTDSLGLRVTTFGAPFNKADKTTSRVLDETPAIQCVLFQPPGGDREVFKRVVDIENGTGKPDRAFFEPQYRAHPSEDYLVLQVHPNAIDETGFAEFERVVTLLLADGCTFTTADAYRSLEATRRAAKP